MRSALFLLLLFPALAVAQAPCDVSLTVQPISCAGADDGGLTVVTNSGGPFTYFWAHDGALVGPAAAALPPGAYSVVVEDVAAGCISLFDTVLVEPDILIIGTVDYCPSAPPVLTATPIGGFTPVDILWSTGDTLPVVNIPGGTTGNVDVTATDANGCVVNDQVTLTELVAPFVAFTAVDSACMNVAFVVNLTSTNADSLVWEWGGFGFSNVADPTVAFPQPLWQPISLQGFDSLGCGSEPLLDSIYIHPQVPAIFTAMQIPCSPVVNILLGSDADSCAFFIGDSLVTHDCNGFLSWDFGRYDVYDFTLYATQLNTCNDTLTATVDVRTEPTLFLANAFTPNEDGINDQWPVHVDIPDLGYELQLFDRWGASLWATTDPQEQWDASDVPMGVYVYTMKMRDPCSATDEIVKTGHVTVFR
jgi:gliding motility-associated-like protein